MVRGLDGYFLIPRLIRPAVQFSGPGGGPGLDTDFGGDSEGETPLPIPNREVKPLSADGTWPARAWESRSPPVFIRGPPHGAALFMPCALKRRRFGYVRHVTLATDRTPHRDRGGARRDPASGFGHRPATPVLGGRAPGRRGAYRAGSGSVGWILTSRSTADTRRSPRPMACCSGLALAGGLLQRARRAQAGQSAGSRSALAALEGDLRVTPVSRLLSRRPTANLAASVAPTATPRQRVCLVGHMDSTRYGLMFIQRRCDTSSC